MSENVVTSLRPVPEITTDDYLEGGRKLGRFAAAELQKLIAEHVKMTRRAMETQARDMQKHGALLAHVMAYRVGFEETLRAARIAMEIPHHA